MMNTLTESAMRVTGLPSKPGDPPWEIAFLFPPQGQWTEAEYLSLQKKTTRLIELSEGRVEVLPMPTPFHQGIVRFLFRMLEVFVIAQGTGEVFFAPLPIRLWQGKFRDPDLAFFRPGRLTDRHRQPQGADLVMEVVSPDEEDRQRDITIKREEYARASILEYWIVDPQERRITVLSLDGQTDRVFGECGPGTTASSLLLTGFAVSVDAVFAAGEGNRQA
jgi:Uma2 family endonuclease